MPRLLGLAAVILLLIGVSVSIFSWHTNVSAEKRAVRLIQQANNNQGSDAPSTTSISSQAFNDYHVAPNLPRYIFIPKIKVKAIVLSLNTTDDQLQAPPNIYETGWYKKSSLPGQMGAMLIDGHVSSWTSRGVFYGLKTLVPGDTIQIERGDGIMFTYKVVKSQTYSASNVNMAAALTPIDPNKPGLNLITCTGKVIAGTSEFNQRVVVFAEQT